MMRFHSWFSYFLFACYFVVISACGSDEQQADFSSQRAQQLSNIFENGAAPIHDQILPLTANLSETAQRFKASPSTENLVALQNAWKNTVLKWKQAELYDWGDISNSFLHFRIHRWPIDTEAIEDAIAEGTNIDETYINQRGSSAIGFGAIEYLLFQQDATTTLADLTTNTNRLDYLVSLCHHVNTTMIQLKDRWAAFGPTFSTATDLAIMGGQNQLVNALIAYLEESIRFRLGKPLGDENGGMIDTDMVETPFAHTALLTQKAGFEEWDKIYHGSFGQDNGFGFDDYLIALGNETLGPRIDEAISNINNKLSSLSTSNAEGNLAALIQEEGAEVSALQSEMRQLLTLVKTELTSIIGATVTVNDTDGD